MMPPSQEITRLLASLSDGASNQRERLFQAIYDELCGIAHRQLNQRRSGQTLNTTALVHEAYLKLVDQTQVTWESRNHFFGVAATAMRHILVDRARRRKALKRGGGAAHTLLDEAGGMLDVDTRSEEILALDQALVQLATLDARLSQVVELRFFGGLSVEETAAVLDMSARTVKRDWRKARAILYSTLQEN